MPRACNRGRRLTWLALGTAIVLAAGLLLGTRAGARPDRVASARLAWHPCGAGTGLTGPGYGCASLTVPRDPARPGGATVELAVSRHLPQGSPGGVLFVNPGGPGDSAVTFLHAAVDTRLWKRFELVGFDPLGVGRSDPVTCLTGHALGRYLALDPDPPTRAGADRLIGAEQRFAAACARHSAAILRDTGTVDAARDMDLVRRALGVAKIDYLGYSYGTLLGATYAQAFGGHVRAMVLDGPVDPRASLSSLAFVRYQAAGYSSEFRRFAAWCAARSACQWHPHGNPLVALSALEQRLRGAPIRVRASAPVGPADGLVRRVGPSELLTAVEATLLSGRYGWNELAEMLHAAAHRDGQPVLSQFDAILGEVPTGESDAVSCMDAGAPTLAQARAAARTPRPGEPFDVGGLVVNGELQCASWPAAPTDRAGTIHAPHAPAILVVANRHDPATPYPGARALAAQLDHARLLTRSGDGHTSYAFSACIRGHVDAYLERRVLPAPHTVCPSDR